MSKDYSSEIDPAAPIAEQAAMWWILLNDFDATACDKKAFGHWIARSPDRIEAFLRAAMLAKAMASKHVRWPDTPAEVLVSEAKHGSSGVIALFKSEPRHDWLNGPRSRRRTLLYGIAAGVLLAVGSAFFLLERPRQFTTALGEQRSVVLNDGSIVTLNTSSSIEITFGKERRIVRLLAGEALFKVAHDSNRPFDVVAGGTTVRAVGTQFNVYRDSRDTQANTVVTVLEGKVSVESSQQRDGRDAAISSAPSQGPLFLVQGEAAVVTPKAPPRATVANVAVATAWMQRRLIFERRPLAEVAAEFNRYNRQEIMIDGTQLRDQEVTGVFQADDPGSFLEFLATLPGVRIEREENTTRVISTE